MPHFRACGERAEYELAQMFRVTHGHMYEVIVRAGEVEDAPDFGQGHHMLFEATDRGARVDGESHRHQRFERHPVNSRIDVGVVTEDGPRLLEAPHPREATRRCESDARREHLVRDPCIVLEMGKNLAVYSVRDQCGCQFPN